MTALEQFVRLEAMGIWRASPEAKPREVVVSFGNATLVLRDLQDHPLGHWALDATRIIARTEAATTYATSADADETLEIADFEMIRAIEMIGGGKPLSRMKPKRLPRWLFPAAALAVAAMLVWWGPDLLRRYAAGLIPRAQAEQIGDAMLAEIAALQGAACQNPIALPAAQQLMTRLFPADATWKLHFLPMNARPTASLPGGHVLVNSALLASLHEPDELAGYVALEAARASAGAPLTTLLNDAGLGVSMRLLLRGQIGQDVARQTAGQILAGAGLPELRFDPAAVALLAAAGINPRPFALALTRSGVEYSRASGFDVPPSAESRPALEDQDWVALQDICEQ